MVELRHSLHICFQRPHITQTVAIALIVGTWLTLFNHWQAILLLQLDHIIAVKIALNYLTPLIVANLGLLARHDT